MFIVTNKKFWFVVIMAAQNEEEIRLEENLDQGPLNEHVHNNEGSSATHVLETMRNLIVELQISKSNNEKMKKAQEYQQGINEMLFCSIVTNKSPKDDDKEEEDNKISSKIFGHETKN